MKVKIKELKEKQNQVIAQLEESQREIEELKRFKNKQDSRPQVVCSEVTPANQEIEGLQGQELEVTWILNNTGNQSWPLKDLFIRRLVQSYEALDNPDKIEII